VNLPSLAAAFEATQSQLNVNLVLTNTPNY